jgi:broad specificity phosphatase PhoE
MALKLREGVTLYFSRHGETEANIKHQFSGVKDTPLTPKGEQQARDIGHILARELGPAPKLDYVCSPLQRAKTTMQLVRISAGLPRLGYHTDPRLEEIDLGVWDQLTDKEARDLDPEIFDRRGADKWHVRVPGGENYADVAHRLEEFIADVDRDTFAISHGAATRILRGLFAGLSWQEMSNLDETQGVVFCVRNNTVVRFDP